WPQEGLIEDRHQVRRGDRQDRRLLGLALANAEQTQDLVLETILGQRIHLVEQLIERAAAAAEHHAAETAGIADARAGLADGVDLVDEQDARAVLARELAGLVIEAEDAQGVHAPEHALDARRRHVAKRELGFRRDGLTEIALARAWRAFEQQTAD